MSRPVQEALDSTSADWVTRLNSNFEKVLDAPVPFALFASVSALNSAHNPKLYTGCFALVGEDTYISDGTSWELYVKQLDYIADLDTGTATVEDVKNAYNALRIDLIAKGYMSV